MRLPILPASVNPQVYVKGDVRIEDQVAIAPGVILQADADSQIIIRSGVCIGMGTIIHAHQGTWEVESGAVLGAGVLLLGSGTVGSNACIGTSSTVWNQSVAASQLVAPGSLLIVPGESAIVSEPKSEPKSEPEISSPMAEDPPSAPPAPPVTLAPQPCDAPEPPPSPPPPQAIPDPFGDPPEPPLNSAPLNNSAPLSPVPSAPPHAPPVSTFFAGGAYGQANLNRLLVTLFPHHPSANTLTPDPSKDIAPLEPDKPSEESL